VKEDVLEEIISRYVKKEKISGEDFLDFEEIVPIGNVENQYEQRIAKWGTKWNSLDVFIDDTGINFYTAWTPPIPIIKKLAELHKDIEFTLAYHEPGVAFRGIATAKWDGEKVSLNDKCWDMTEKDYEELGYEYEPQKESEG
jgi:hypothetical protein